MFCITENVAGWIFVHCDISFRLVIYAPAGQYILIGDGKKICGKK